LNIGLKQTLKTSQWWTYNLW